MVSCYALLGYSAADGGLCSDNRRAIKAILCKRWTPAHGAFCHLSFSLLVGKWPSKNKGACGSSVSRSNGQHCNTFVALILLDLF